MRLAHRLAPVAVTTGIHLLLSKRMVCVVIVYLVMPAGDRLVAEPPPDSGQWEPIPLLTDEFDGQVLDAKKWHDHNPHWDGRKPGFFSPKNVRVSQGKLHLVTRKETLPDLPDGYHTFTTAAVKGKALAHYGYYEIRCRAMPSKASSAFWFYRATDDYWTEIDVFEICGRGDAVRNLHTNAHVFRTPKIKKHRAQHEVWKAPFDPTKDDHVYGLLWDRDWIAWYVDGIRVRRIKNTDWHQPLHLNLDSETFPDWFGLPEAGELPATFSIDYVRAWKRR